MKFFVAYDQHGRILGAAANGGDQPSAGPGVTVAEMDIPSELKSRDPESFFHLLHVDVAKRKLISRAS